MKIAFLVCKKTVAVDSVIEVTDQTLSDFLDEYVKQKNYAGSIILAQDSIQMRAIIYMDNNPDKHADNTLGVIAFSSN